MSGQARQSDGQAYVRPASDDSVPLREYLERLITELARHVDSTMAAESKRTDNLRAEAKIALDAAFASADKALQTALQATRSDATRSDAVAEKRFAELNDMRKAVATSTEVDAIKGVVAAQQRSIDKLEGKIEVQAAAVAGRAGGLKDYIGWIAFALTLISALVGFAVMLRR